MRRAKPVGRVQPWRRSYRIDFGRHWPPRYLYSFRGVGFESKEMANAILAHVEVERSKERELADILSEIAPESQIGASDIETMVQAWIEEFERRVRAGHRQPRTLREYARWARDDGHFAFWYGRGLFEVDEAAIDEWGLQLAEQGLHPKTQTNVLSGFRSFLQWAKKRRKTFTIPPFPWPEKQESIPVTLSAEQQLAVLNAIPEGQRGLFLALATTGARPSEARVIRVRAWDGDSIRLDEGAKDRLVDGVVRGPKKERAKRVVPVVPVLADWLRRCVPAERRLQDPDGWLFQNPAARNIRKQWSDTCMRRDWAKAAAKAGVECGLYQGTKHTLATLLKQGGHDDRTIAAVLGHADIRSVEPYARVQNTTVRAALLRLHPGL